MPAVDSPHFRMDMRILIDNGHGENTAGKRSPDGRLREYAWAREVARELNRRLRTLGYDSELIVRESIDVSLKERCRRVNEVCKEVGKKNVILISIHVNAAGNGSRWYTAQGWSAYTTKGETDADALALHLYNAADKYFKGRKVRKYNGPKAPDFEENFYILANTQCPAVLTENFFQDNHSDVDFLMSPIGKCAIVDCHVEGIVNYIRSKRK